MTRRILPVLKHSISPAGLSRPRAAVFSIVSALLALLCGNHFLHADQVEMQNGDRYAGKVLALNTNAVVLQSEVLGLVNLPREKVANIALGTVMATNVVPSGAPIAGKFRAPAISATNAPRELTAKNQLPGDTNVIRQVEERFLSGASPEAKAKFNELAGGLMSGTLSVSDIRKEAKAAADQLRAAKRDLGPEASEAFDGYLAILDAFLRDSAAEAAPASKAPASSASAKAPGRLEE